MIFTDQEILWAFKATLLEQQDKLKLVEQEKVEFREFINSIQIDMIPKIITEAVPLVHGVNPLELDYNYLESLKKKNPKLYADLIKAKEKLTREGIPEESKIVKGILGRYGLKGKIGAAALITVLAILGYLLYKRYKDACRKGCKDSADKTACIKKCRIVSTKSTISKLKAEKARCGKEAHCQMKFDKQIKKWENKLNSLKK